MADFFDEQFALHACFISATTRTVDGQDAFERIPVETSEAVMMQASALDGDEAVFDVKAAPTVSEVFRGAILEFDHSLFFSFLS